MASKPNPQRSTLQAFNTESLLEELAQRSSSAEDANESSLGMLQILADRGGHPGALARAALLCAKKSVDYNGLDAELQSIHSIDRSGYFPFGVASYAQMLHTKAQRFNSLVLNQQRGLAPNFEGLRDTALDIINYAGFYLADDEVSQDA